MFYLSADDNAIGAASSSSGLGPYSDWGCVLKAEDLGKTTLTDPFFAVFASTSYYLCYTTDDGSYVQQLTIGRGKTPTLKGSATKLTDTNMTDIALYRKSSKELYLFATVKTATGTEVRYARASSITGPYLDRNGNSILDGSTGELLIQSSDEYNNPCNVMRGFESENGYFYIAYNATEIGRTLMPSGFARQPMFINPVAMDEDGWFTSVISPVSGWTSPRYE
jgi:beta-xylosidase